MPGTWQQPARVDPGREGRVLFWMRHSQAFGKCNKAFLQILENPKPLVSSAAVQELFTALGGGTVKSPAEPGSTEPAGPRPPVGLTAAGTREGRAAARLQRPGAAAMLGEPQGRFSSSGRKNKFLLETFWCPSYLG